MYRANLYFLAIIFLLITVVTFVVGLAAQDTEHNSTNVQDLVKIAQEHVKQNRIKQAIETYEKIVKASPDDYESRIRLGKLYDAEGNEDAAIENYKKASLFEHGDTTIYLKLAEHYFLNDDMTAAEAALKNAHTYIKPERDQAKIERQLIKLYRLQGKLDEMLQKADAEGTLSIEMQKERAQHFRNTNQLDKAAVYLQRALKISKTSSQRTIILRELCNVYLQQDRTDLILDFYETEMSKQIYSISKTTTYSRSGITKTFGSDETRDTLIDAYKKRGKLEELITHFEGKLEKDATNPAALVILAEIYWHINDYRKAAEAYLKLSKIEPMGWRNIHSFYQAAAAYHKCNLPDMVKVVINQADTALESNNTIQSASSLGTLATICLKNEMYDPALKLAANAVSRIQKGSSSFSGYHYEILAKCFLAVERYEAAFDTYQQMAKEGRGRSMQERAEIGMNEAAKAGKLYEKWIPEQLKQVAENPHDPKYILKLAQSYEATDKIKQAVTQYQRLTELDPVDSQWHKKLAYLYQNLPQENREPSTLAGNLNAENLEKSIAAYERAIELEPTSYQLYDLLAKLYMKSDRNSDAERVYSQALDAPLSKWDHESAVRTIAGFYTDEGQENKRIAILEKFKPIVDQSDDLHELLADLYKKAGDTDKAELAHAKWLHIRLKTLNRTQGANSYRSFADRLLDKGIYPEVALNFAKRAFYKNTYSEHEYPQTLGRAYVANGLYDKALKYFKYALILISGKYSSDKFWEEIVEISNEANDQERYIQILETLIDSMPPEGSTTRAKIHRIIAEFYGKNDMTENAEKFLRKSGFIPETCWVTLGPFENIDSRGVFYAYIPEGITQIDATAKYYGRDQLISWEKPSDHKLDGRFDFGNTDGINNDSAAYAWTNIISPKERDVVIRFDSDDQGIVWLNGEKVFEHFRARGVQIDHYTIPVTLKKGENSILVKVGNVWLTWEFYLRLTDANGIPFGDLKFKNANELLQAIPPKSTSLPNLNLSMAAYYSKNNMPDKAMEQMRQTGFIHENSWWVLGPFDNTTGIGYNMEYIPENTTQINITAKYESIDGEISWEKFTDDVFDGFIDLGRNINWRVSYLWTTITSQDEREVQLRFGSDDQAKVWFNGKMVTTYSQNRYAVVDDEIIPITLNAGKNTILVKVCNEEKSWGFYMRVTDTDGKPYEDLEFNKPQK